jgi:hypothetical protein
LVLHPRNICGLLHVGDIGKAPACLQPKTKTSLRPGKTLYAHTSTLHALSSACQLLLDTLKSQTVELPCLTKTLKPSLRTLHTKPIKLTSLTKALKPSLLTSDSLPDTG